jgi:tetratricopeptide (TPR) repeat protein
LSVRALALGLVLVALAGCASSARLLWEEYTSEGISSLGAGQYGRAEQFLNRALGKAEELGAQERGISLNSLGELYRRQGRARDAERMFLRALAVKEARLGADHPDVATTLTNLGLLYVAGGRDQTAAPLLERALLIQETRLGPQHPALARTLATLADAYRHLGREHDAFVLDVRARMLREEPAPGR